jgi:hypothetical protein
MAMARSGYIGGRSSEKSRVSLFSLLFRAACRSGAGREVLGGTASCTPCGGADSGCVGSSLLSRTVRLRQRHGPCSLGARHAPRARAASIAFLGRSSSGNASSKYESTRLARSAAQSACDPCSCPVRPVKLAAPTLPVALAVAGGSLDLLLDKW